MKKSVFVLLIGISFFIGVVQTHADDTDLFTAKVSPDALIILDLSGSMVWTPAEVMFVPSSASCVSSYTGAFYLTSGTGHTYQCTVTGLGGNWYSNSSCSGPFYTNNGNAGYTTPCRRIDVARAAVASMLDYTKDGTVNCKDEAALGVRMGYEQFVDCSPSNITGCITMPVALPDSSYTCGSDYANVLSAVNNATTSGNTPLGPALDKAVIYLNTHKSNDPAKSCRRKAIILITDGSDTLACNGDGSSSQADQYKRRRETVARAKAAADAGYMVYVVGVGASMPHHLRNTLNWAAYYGGTDNPIVDNSGDTKGYNSAIVSSCQDSPSASHDRGDGLHYYATSNDPGEANLVGYAFITADASQLTTALTNIIAYIGEATYSFTSPTIPTARTTDNNVLYMASFVPSSTPFWKGSLKAYQLATDGTLPVDPYGNPFEANTVWDAAENLQRVDPNSRNILTYVNNSLKSFTSGNLTNPDLNVSSDAERQKLIDHIRGIDAYDINKNGNTTEKKDWILGDIFHSNPVIVGSPSSLFEDEGFSTSGGFYELNKNRTKVIIAGANDGMLHAFDAATGVEQWAFIPNCLLKNLKTMIAAHTYYVDSSPKVADVWFDLNLDGKKTANEWKTVLVCGLRKGGQSYFALDITDTLNPKYLWEFPNPLDPNYADLLNDLGQSWSEPAIGKVKIAGKEKWVAFIGGGFNYPNPAGKAFFTVDMQTGLVVKDFPGITKAMAAPPLAVDTNHDGYIERVYAGDALSQMWVFDVSDDNVANWNGKTLFQAPFNKMIYYQPAVAFDKSGTLWVYFGTGDREAPNGPGLTNADRFYAIKDDGKGTYPRQETDLVDVTSNNTFKPDTGKEGWYIQLEKSAGTVEQVIAKPAVFNNLVYFTTYTQATAKDPCSPAGIAKLYMVEYLSGGGALTVDDPTALPGTPSERSKVIGSGIPSTPVISINLKGEATAIIGTTSGQIFSKKAPLKHYKAILYWREVLR